MIKAWWQLIFCIVRLIARCSNNSNLRLACAKLVQNNNQIFRPDISCPGTMCWRRLLHCDSSLPRSLSSSRGTAELDYDPQHNGPDHSTTITMRDAGAVLLKNPEKQRVKIKLLCLRTKSFLGTENHNRVDIILGCIWKMVPWILHYRAQFL